MRKKKVSWSFCIINRNKNLTLLKFQAISYRVERDTVPTESEIGVVVVTVEVGKQTIYLDFYPQQQ